MSYLVLKSILERAQKTGRGYALCSADYKGRYIQVVGESVYRNGSRVTIDGVEINLDSVIASHHGNETIVIDSNGQTIISSSGVNQKVRVWHQFSNNAKPSEQSKQSWLQVGKIAGGGALILGAVLTACYFFRKK